MRERERETERGRQREQERGESFWQSPVFFWRCACACKCVCLCVTSARWLTGCCSAFWQTLPLNHSAVVTHSDRTPLPPWDSSIRVSHALNEEVNMLNCLLEMKWGGCLNAACHMWCPHISLFEVIYITQIELTWLRAIFVPQIGSIPCLSIIRMHNTNVVCCQQKENRLRYVGTMIHLQTRMKSLIVRGVRNCQFSKYGEV